MKVPVFFSVIMAVTGLILICAEGYPQPNTPKQNITSDIPAEVKEALKGLYSMNPPDLLMVGVELRKLGSRAVTAIPFLIDLLGDRTELMRPHGFSKYATLYPTSRGREAAKALAIIGTPAVRPLLNELMNQDLQVRGNAAFALGLIGDSRAVIPLISALKDRDSHVRENAATALGKIRDQRAGEHLVSVLKEDTNTFVRREAAKALGEIRGSGSMEALIAALRDEDVDVAEQATEALGKIKDPRAVKPLIILLKDKHSFVRGIVVRALGEISDPCAIEPLITVLRDQDSVNRYWAREALEKITGEDFEGDPEKWQQWWRQNQENFHRCR
jgi:HEAT repeat protein